MKSNQLFIMLIFGIIAFIGCNDRTESNQTIGETSVGSDGIIMIADTITYNVELTNKDPEDYVSAEFLKKLETRAFIENIMAKVTNGELTAFDYFTGEKIEIQKLIKDLKKGMFKLDDFAQMQFCEEWTFDTARLVFSKQVKSIVLGYKITDKENNIKGYKPAFKIYLNHLSHANRK